ncbi:patatin-like phospholipase family protein [Brumimicrobium mesophilum]|uniref:patatin-like phospholipase family protein n=1 Tax=Brumimicrobium mesophilum TaxID=392717 RepID=UPI000D143F4A|nr:patatin-like phospholipase family protein [Brumimicrobium mesophilum]
MSERKIENLVFKGGGVLGMAYAGAVEALEEKNILAGVKSVSGTSAGSILALMISLGYNSAEIKKMVNATNFKDFEDHWDPFRIATHYGLYKGDYLLKWIKDIIKKKTNDENITYAELSLIGTQDLKVFATDLTLGIICEFSSEKTPDVIVAESIRASMSIPIFFHAWKFTNSKPNDHIYVDGGVLYNFPISIYEPEKTLGFYLYSEKKEINVKKELKYDHLLGYIEHLFQAMLKAQEIDFLENIDEKSITVIIDDFGISATNFKIDDQQKIDLFNSGKNSTIAHLES